MNVAHRLHSWLDSWGSPASSKRAMIPALKAQIDAVVQSTTQLTHSFWTDTLHSGSGRIPLSQEPVIRPGVWVAQHSKIPCLRADRTQDAIETWTYASELYANASGGVAYVFRGENVGRKRFRYLGASTSPLLQNSLIWLAGIRYFGQQTSSYRDLPYECASV
jgi:hypothetical protein